MDYRPAQYEAAKAALAAREIEDDIKTSDRGMEALAVLILVFVAVVGFWAFIRLDNLLT